MSSAPESSASIKASRTNYVLSFAALFVGILLFAIIVLIAYLPNRDTSFDSNRTQKREESLRELRAKETEQLKTYAVLDKESGKVRLPIEQAMKLVVRDLGKKE